MGLNPKEIKLLKLNEKDVNKEIQGKMITNVKLKDFKNLPISRTTINILEINVPVKVLYKRYKPGDIIIGDLITNDTVISKDIICEFVNRGDIEDNKITNINVKKIKW